MLEHYWGQAKNLVLASKRLKIYKHKVLQTSHPHCSSLKWVKLGSLNNISDFLVWTPSLAPLEYTLINRTYCHPFSCIRLFYFRSNYCSYTTRFETDCAFSCSFDFKCSMLKMLVYSCGHILHGYCQKWTRLTFSSLAPGKSWILVSTTGL